MKLSRGKLWARAMMTLILDSGTKHFRWFDSGDLQDERMLDEIIRVCEATPHVQHWLPTKEYKLVKGRTFPKNLVVRISAHKLNTMPPEIAGTVGSMVFTEGPPAGTVECKAMFQGHKCLDCRACWDPNNKVIAYPEH
jgi:hypothetical protein